MGQSWAHLGRILAIMIAIIIIAKFTFILNHTTMIYVTIAMTLGLPSDINYTLAITFPCTNYLSWPVRIINSIIIIPKLL